MFNQKVNHLIYKNPDYVNKTITAPDINPITKHYCAVTINKYSKSKECDRLPLQDWCYKNMAVETFGMRPIVNSKDYFQSIKSYLSSVILQDYQNLQNSKLSGESYSLIQDLGLEPLSSFLQAIRLDVISKLEDIMNKACDSVEIFKNYNPVSEGFVITDIISVNTYKSNTNDFHYYHNVVFNAVNTSRYNTIAFKAEVYQDTTNIMDNWKQIVNDLTNSKDIDSKLASSASTVLYIGSLGFVNDTSCVLGQEDECSIPGYSLDESRNINMEPIQKNKWLAYPSLNDNSYSAQGNYSDNGNIKISDSGPDNLDNLIKELGY